MGLNAPRIEQTAGVWTVTSPATGRPIVCADERRARMLAASLAQKADELVKAEARS